MGEFDDEHALFHFHKSTVLKFFYGGRNEGIVEALPYFLDNNTQGIIHFLKLSPRDVTE